MEALLSWALSSARASSRKSGAGFDELGPRLLQHCRGCLRRGRWRTSLRVCEQQDRLRVVAARDSTIQKHGGRSNEAACAELVGQRSADEVCAGVDVAFAGGGQARVPAGPVRGRRFVLGLAAQHRFRFRTRPAAAGWLRTSSSCCWSSVSSHAVTCTPPASTRSSSPTAHMPRRSLPRLALAAPSKTSFSRILRRSARECCRSGSLTTFRAWPRSSARMRVAAGPTRNGCASTTSTVSRAGGGLVPEILSHIADPDVRAIAAELTDGRFYYATRRVGCRRRRAAGVQPARRHRRSLVHHERIRQPQHRGAPDPAGDGDAA